MAYRVLGPSPPIAPVPAVLHVGPGLRTYAVLGVQPVWHNAWCVYPGHLLGVYGPLAAAAVPVAAGVLCVWYIPCGIVVAWFFILLVSLATYVGILAHWVGTAVWA